MDQNLMSFAPDPVDVPLSQNCLFRSADLDEARAIVARKFCEHRLDLASRKGRFRAVHNRVEGHETSLNFIRYGADVQIDPGELGSFYLVQLPMKGCASIDNSAGEIASTQQIGSVLNPHVRTSMRWREGCAQRLLQIDSVALNRVAARLAGRVLDAPVTFETAVDHNRAGVREWVKRLQTCFELASKGAIYGAARHHSQALVEEQLITGFLMCQPSNMSDRFTADPNPAANIHVRRAVRYLQEHFAEPLTVGDVAAQVGVSSRALQMAFRADLDQSPLQYLREIRLNEARHLLRTASATEAIADICDRVGFGHSGRFSVAYKARFGESPHETRDRTG